MIGPLKRGLPYAFKNLRVRAADTHAAVGYLFAMPTAALPPHPDLPHYDRDAGRKRQFLRDLFDDTAADYDRVENAMALGSGRWYRRQALKRAGLGEGQGVCDVAVGTGLVAREALRLVGPNGSVLGVDPSAGMLGRARAALGINAVMGVAEQLPLADASFDFVSMGYALRHVGDLRSAFGEFARVLKPGGRVCVLEIARPDGRVGRGLMAAYFRGVLPVLSRIAGRRRQTRSLWRYYWDTIEQCVPGTVIMDAMRDSGFVDVKRRTELGMFAEYTGAKA